MISFTNCMDDPNIFAGYFRDPQTWQAWRTFAKVIFGEPLSESEQATYTECTHRTDTPAAGFDECWAVCGRRAGKSLLMALISVYLACFRDYRDYLQPGEMGTLAVIASDRRQARLIYRYVSAALNQAPMLAQLIKNETADSIELHNGCVIEIVTASYRAARGYTLIAAVADEIAYWHSDESSRNPDSEIIAAIRPGLSTVPGAKLLCISSPYARRGELWENHKRYYGIEGSDVLIWKAASRTMNPTLKQSIVDRAFEQDSEKAASEYMAEFRSDISSFIQREVVENAVDKGVFEKPYQPGKRYMAFCDPSGGSADSFTACIAHMEKDVVVLDKLVEIKAPFVPTDAVAQIAKTLKEYHLFSVTGDRYAAQWTVDAFRNVGITYNHSKLTRSEIYTELLPALNAGRVRLLDNPRAVSQIVNLERRTSRGGKDSIDHSPGCHDDVANSIAGVVTLVAERAQPSGGSMSLYEAFRQGNPENRKFNPATGRHEYAPPTVWTPMEDNFKQPWDY